MLPSQEKILKRNTDFKELVLSCFCKCIETEHNRVKDILEAEREDHDQRLYEWTLRQFKGNTIINNQFPKEARPEHIEAVLAMFDELADDDIKYMPLVEGKADLNNYVDWDLSKPLIKAKIIASEYLYGLAL
jgi:diketogulonate reductase-like aldo/keto reductase